MMNIGQDRRIIELMSEFADERFQKRSWFAIGPEVTSPDEMCNQFLDFDCISWIESNSGRIGPFLERYLRDFLLSVEVLPEYLDPWVAFSSTEWVTLRLKASVIHDLLIEKIGSRKLS